jgi:hypothetical protein
MYITKEETECHKQTINILLFIELKTKQCHAKYFFYPTI